MSGGKSVFAGAILELARHFNVHLSPEQLVTLADFAGLVATWSKRTSLVSTRVASSPDSLAEVLFADAFVLAGSIVPNAARVVDVGSGVGAPILPLLILRADLSAVLIEPRRKRVAFLNTAIGLSDLPKRATVLAAKVSTSAVPDGLAVPFDVAISRATFPPKEWLSLGQKLARQVIVLAAQEAVLPRDHERSMWCREYVLPSSGAPRVAVAFDSGLEA